MRRDKPMVGLHQHMRIAKASRVTDRHSSGAQWEWAGEGAAKTWKAANLPPASLLMPTICVCNSSPTSQEPPQAHTQVNKHPERAVYWLTLYLALLITNYQCPKSREQEPVERGNRV